MTAPTHKDHRNFTGIEGWWMRIWQLIFQPNQMKHEWDGTYVHDTPGAQCTKES